jgi:alpha-beta hydrolase superfamily lysophospholipase
MTTFQHIEGTFTGVKGTEIYFRRWLPDTGIQRGVIVIVHGLGEHSGRYQNVVDQLLPEGYAIYALDHRGFGRSGGKRGHVDRFQDYEQDVKHLVELARQEQPGWELALFGHSMGGLIGLAYALDYPDTLDYLVISAPALAADSPRPLVMLMRIANRLYPRFTITRPGDGAGISRDPQVVQAFIQDPLFVPVSTARWAVEMLTTQQTVMARAGELRLPLLMVQGMADTVVRPDATIAFFERVASEDKTLLQYPGYFHELHNDIGKEKPLGDLVAWLNQRMPLRVKE